MAKVRIVRRLWPLGAFLEAVEFPVSDHSPFTFFGSDVNTTSGAVHEEYKCSCWDYRGDYVPYANFMVDDVGTGTVEAAAWYYLAWKNPEDPAGKPACATEVTVYAQSARWSGTAAETPIQDVDPIYPGGYPFGGDDKKASTGSGPVKLVAKQAVLGASFLGWADDRGFKTTSAPDMTLPQNHGGTYVARYGTLGAYKRYGAERSVPKSAWPDLGALAPLGSVVADFLGKIRKDLEPQPARPSPPVVEQVLSQISRLLGLVEGAQNAAEELKKLSTQIERLSQDERERVASKVRDWAQALEPLRRALEKAAGAPAPAPQEPGTPEGPGKV